MEFQVLSPDQAKFGITPFYPLEFAIRFFPIAKKNGRKTQSEIRTNDNRQGI